MSLPILSFVVRWPGECVQAFETGNGSRHPRAELVTTFQKTGVSQRQYCSNCGEHMMTIHPLPGLVDVFAATLPVLAFAPSVRVNHAETVLPMRAGLRKLKDLPAKFGGSGEIIGEE